MKNMTFTVWALPGELTHGIRTLSEVLRPFKDKILNLSYKKLYGLLYLFEICLKETGINYAV